MGTVKQRVTYMLRKLKLTKQKEKLTFSVKGEGVGGSLSRSASARFVTVYGEESSSREDRRRSFSAGERDRSTLLRALSMRGSSYLNPSNMDSSSERNPPFCGEGNSSLTSIAGVKGEKISFWRTAFSFRGFSKSGHGGSSKSHPGPSAHRGNSPPKKEGKKDKQGNKGKGRGKGKEKKGGRGKK